MNKIIIIVFVLDSVLLFGQTNPQTYLFAEDLYQKIEKDTVPWRYQTGATEFSFTGRYPDVLRVWDKNGVGKPNATKEDSLYFVRSKKVNARDYIIQQSENARVIIINEAHHVASHRTFTRTLLQDLYDNGFRYLGLEALFDSAINDRKYPIIESGYYTQEPEFGNLLSEALEIGFTAFGYEASRGKNGTEREIEQAENIKKFIERNPPGKVLIHCGYAHAYENEYRPWGKAMAGRLKEYLKTDPLTIDQTMFLEKSDQENNHLYLKLIEPNHPVVLIDERDRVFSGFAEPKQTDIVVIHPETKFINNRPDWFIAGKRRYVIPISRLKNHKTVMIFAYRKNEFEHNGVPADIVEISDADLPVDLYLKRGKYAIVIRNRDYDIVERFDVKLK